MCSWLRLGDCKFLFVNLCLSQCFRIVRGISHVSDPTCVGEPLLNLHGGVASREGSRKCSCAWEQPDQWAAGICVPQCLFNRGL